MNKITFKNDMTGETARVKVGFSFILFFFSSFFGIPLFLRKLYLFGVIMLILVCTNFTLSIFSYNYFELEFLTYVIQLGMIGLNIFLGVKGNKMTALNYIKLGYKITDKEDYKINMVKESWNLPDTAFEKIN